MSPNSPIAYWRLFVTVLWVILLDQLSKIWILHHLPIDTYFLDSIHQPIAIIPHFFYIVHIQNIGAAWGILAGYTFWLIALGFVALFMLYFYRKEFGLNRPILQYAFGLLIGGIIGNMIDRIAYGGVIDFLDFHFGSYRYPAFNVADCGITIGVTVYIIVSIYDWVKKPSGSETAHN